MRSVARFVAGIGTSVVIAWGMFGCADLGDPITAPPGPAPPEPAISRILPGRTVVGDTLEVSGARFGIETGEVDFSGAARAVGDVLEWDDTRIRVLVPAGATDGPVVVRNAEGGESPGMMFSVAPAAVTYADLLPLFVQFGCSSCHGGEGNLFVEPYESLMGGGSTHGPVVVPRRSDESLLVQVVRGTTSTVARMPDGGPYLSAAQAQVFADFVDQGARPSPAAR
ncbi:MAG: hypothetical protein R3B81_12655 [bacterium]